MVFSTGIHWVLIMRKSVRWGIISLFAILALAYVISYLILQFFMPPQKSKLTPWPLFEDMKLIRKALKMYEGYHGHFPYDDRGPEYALYQLRPYLVKLPGILPEAVWNEKAEKLNILPTVYMNPVPGSSRTNKEDRLLLWIQVNDKGRLGLRESGIIFYKDFYKDHW